MPARRTTGKKKPLRANPQGEDRGVQTMLVERSAEEDGAAIATALMDQADHVLTLL